MVIAARAEPDRVAQPKRVLDHPLELSPRRPHLDQRLDLVVMEFEVGRPAADVRHYHGTATSQPGEELVRIGTLSLGGRLRSLPAARPEDLRIVLEKVHISVAAIWMDRRPFVARDGYKPPGGVERRCSILHPLPELGRDLEVIPLMAAEVQQSRVTSKGEIVCYCIRADSFLALPVQVAPIGAKLPRFGRHTNRW